MFGIKKQMESLESSVRNAIHTKDWKITQLTRELKDKTCALEKQRRRNSELRHEIRRMRKILKDNDIPTRSNSSSTSPEGTP